MKRVWLCCGILAVIFIFGVGWSVFLGACSRHMNELIDKAQSLAETRSPDTEKAIEELCSYWESMASTAAFFESAETVSGIGDAVARIEYLYRKDNDEFFSECEVIRGGVDRIYRSNMPLLPNR